MTGVGIFIAFEGGDGAGKSTQVRLLAADFEAAGREVVCTRQPGGTALGQALRDLVLHGDDMSPRAEALIFAADKAQHVEEVIRPALARGAIVICDRFSDSSRAYQGAGGGVDAGLIEAMDAAVVGETQPDQTLIFDLPVEDGLARALARGGADLRFESKGLEFHQRLREGFRRVATEYPERCRIIDASGDPDAVFARVWAAVEPVLP